MADPDTTAGASSKTDAHQPKPRVVLVADRTEGAEELATALNADGMSVLTCDVIAIPERASRVDPFAVVIDIEQPNAAPAVSRLIETPERKTVLAAIGTVEVARMLDLPSAERARLFARPLSISDLLAFFRDIARLDGLLPKAPPSSSHAGGSGPGHYDSDSILVSGFSAITGMPEVEGILPELNGGPISTKIAGELSPEIEALLQSSAKRAEEMGRRQEQSAPEPHILVPPEMLALVDDLLSSDEPPETRGGMDLAGLEGALAPAAPGSEARADRSSAHAIPFDSRPSWHTAVPEGLGSDFGSAPGAIASEEELTGAEYGHSEPPPGTATGLAEETSVPGGGTQVGHSSPLEGSAGPPPSAAPDGSEPPPSGSSPPLYTEAGRLPGLPLDESGRRGSYPDEGSSPPRTEAYTAMHSRGPVRLGSDGPPESLPVTSAPSLFSVASSRARRSPESLAPSTAHAEPPAPDTSNRDVVRGDPFSMLATAVNRRLTGALVLSSIDGVVVRRVLLRDGDMVNAASDHEADALLQFLVMRGDLSPEVLRMRSARMPLTGRHAAAALIANGYLGQDDLWPVLRSHAEWIIARALQQTPTAGHLEREPPERLRAEPNVFGGAAGVEVFIESARRVLSAEGALDRLGGQQAVVGEGPSMALLAESALTSEELDRVHAGIGQTVGAILENGPTGFEAVIFALGALGILTARAPSKRPEAIASPDVDPLDADAIRNRIEARMALVHEADYFSLLGVAPTATGYDIRRAFLELRRTFDPSRLLTGATADMHDDVLVILEVLEEAYQVLKDPHRRNRYRRAIEASGPTYG